MSLREGLEKYGRRNEHTICAVQRLKEASPEYGAELEELLAESLVTGFPSLVQLEAKLHELGFEFVKRGAIGRHRIGDCKCEREEA